MTPREVDDMIGPNGDTSEFEPEHVPEDAPEGEKGGSNEVVTTRVNVAFPFSQIKVEEPSQDLAALAALVQELADLLAEVAPGPRAQELGARAQRLASRLT